MAAVLCSQWFKINIANGETAEKGWSKFSSCNMIFNVEMNSPGIHAHPPHPCKHISPAFMHTTYIHMHTRTLHTLTGDSCCNPNSLGCIKDRVVKKVPGVYVNFIQIGDDSKEDTLNGFFMKVDDQITEACANLSVDPKLQNGFNAMGFSQGGPSLWVQGTNGEGGCCSIVVYDLLQSSLSPSPGML